jgi:hypothetical protein
MLVHRPDKQVQPTRHRADIQLRPVSVEDHHRIHQPPIGRPFRLRQVVKSLLCRRLYRRIERYSSHPRQPYITRFYKTQYLFYKTSTYTLNKEFPKNQNLKIFQIQIRVSNTSLETSEVAG